MNRMPSVVTMAFEEREIDLIAAALHYLVDELTRGGSSAYDLKYGFDALSHLDVKTILGRFERMGEMP